MVIASLCSLSYLRYMFAQGIQHVSDPENKHPAVPVVVTLTDVLFCSLEIRFFNKPLQFTVAIAVLFSRMQVAEPRLRTIWNNAEGRYVTFLRSPHSGPD